MNDEERDFNVNIEMFRTVMTAAHVALRSAVIINGGAAVAALAFAGSLVQHGKSVSPVAMALACFGFGVFLAALATGTTYVTQCKYYEEVSSAQVNSNDEVARRGSFWRWTTILLCALSYLMFVVGCGCGVWALGSLT